MTTAKRPVYRITRTTYRGEDGFRISGPRAKIFTTTQGSAEMIRAKYRAGLDDTITLADFYSTAPVADWR